MYRLSLSDRSSSPPWTTGLRSPLDVTTTILDLAGADRSGLPGRSLLQPERHDHIIRVEYNEFGIRRQAIMVQRYKVIWANACGRKWRILPSFSDRFTPGAEEGVLPVSILRQREGLRVSTSRTTLVRRKTWRRRCLPRLLSFSKRYGTFVAASGK